MIRAIVLGELLAWRVWEWKMDKLYSLMYFVEWDADKIMRTQMPVNFDWYGGGFHCYKNIEGTEEWTKATGMTLQFPVVVGTILIWGDIIEHQNGYRAEYAKLNSLDHVWIHHEKSTRFLKKVQKDYGLNSLEV